MSERSSDETNDELRGLGCNAVVMPGIQCTCHCGHRWNVGFVPWSFRPQDAFQCQRCSSWCKSVQLFRDDILAPKIDQA